MRALRLRAVERVGGDVDLAERVGFDAEVGHVGGGRAGQGRRNVPARRRAGSGDPGETDRRACLRVESARPACTRSAADTFGATAATPLLTLLSTVPAMQAAADAARAAGRRLALVPTMGALHDGHLALARDARRRVGPEGHVTVSVFVNPTQFAPGEDFEAYPRTLDADTAALESLGAGVVDAVFAPTAPGMYPFGLPPFTTVAVRDLDRHLCGAARPGHFAGVTTVVAKLFLACRPHVAIFGEKDAQQLAILRRMTAEMGFGIDVAGHPIVREPDGLALSSRNRYLSPDGADGRARAVAGRLRGRAPRGSGRDARGRGRRGDDGARSAARRASASVCRGRRRRRRCSPSKRLSKGGPSAGRYLAAVAAFVGTTRLIDNVSLAIGDRQPDI